MNMRQEEIVNEIRKKCKNVEFIPAMGWHFVYNRWHCFYMPEKNEGMLRFCVPHLFKASEYENERLTEAINETNRNVKFIKAVILDCGSVSLDYDHKTTSDETAETIVPHIINALDFASNYLSTRLNGKKG